MGRILLESGADVPAQRIIKNVVAKGKPTNKTVFAVVEDEDTLQKAIEVVRPLCGDLNAPCKGILFTLRLDPVDERKRRLLDLEPQPGIISSALLAMWPCLSEPRGGVYRGEPGGSGNKWRDFPRGNSPLTLAAIKMISIKIYDVNILENIFLSTK